jgi:hypothetical protein
VTFVYVVQLLILNNQTIDQLNCHGPVLSCIYWYVITFEHLPAFVHSIILINQVVFVNVNSVVRCVDEKFGSDGRVVQVVKCKVSHSSQVKQFIST